MRGVLSAKLAHRHTLSLTIWVEQLAQWTKALEELTSWSQGCRDKEKTQREGKRQRVQRKGEDCRVCIISAACSLLILPLLLCRWRNCVSSLITSYAGLAIFQAPGEPWDVANINGLKGKPSSSSHCWPSHSTHHLRKHLIRLSGGLKSACKDVPVQGCQANSLADRDNAVKEAWSNLWCFSCESAGGNPVHTD